MAKYQVLARRYRPQKFSEVVGQEAILQTLKNALQKETIAHAYLFSGSRGVGKTTLARLFAKALNCAHRSATQEPCNQCPSCQDIATGQSLDVIEIDGASNRGIDDIRQINETVGFAPSHGKYKIYIIDEVHMLTKEAFNALLKTLEEPPEKAKFFFATTEPHKVLPTIISRCQRFDLNRLSIPQIEIKLISIVQDLNRTMDPEAIRLLARYADGALRDAESLLDQILCFCPSHITEADVRNALGLAPQELFTKLDQAFSSSQLSFAFELVEKLFQAGKDPSHFLEQLIEHYRDLTLTKTLHPSQPSPYTQSQCLAILDLLLKAETQMSRSISPRITLETTLLQLLRLKNRIPIEVLVRRLSELESALSSSTTETMQVPDSLPRNFTTESTENTELKKAPIVSESVRVSVSDSPPRNFTTESTEIKPPPIVSESVRVSVSDSLPRNFTTESTENTELKKAPIVSESAPVSVSDSPPRNFTTESTENTELKKAPIVSESAAVSVSDSSPRNFNTESTENTELKKAPIVFESAPVSDSLPRNFTTESTEMRKAEPDSLLTPSQEPNLKSVPFNPLKSSPDLPQPVPLKDIPLSLPSKHQSHYDTLMRFAAVELEGTVKH